MLELLIIRVKYKSVFLLLSQLILDSDILLLYAVFAHQQILQLVHEVALDHNLSTRILTRQVLYVGTAREFDL